MAPSAAVAVFAVFLSPSLGGAAPLAPAARETLPDLILDGPMLEAWVGSAARPLEWRLIARSKERVLYLGESHEVPEIRRELASALPALKAGGVTHLGLESLSSERDGLLKRYAAGQATDAELEAAFDEDWASRGWEIESYIGLVRAARRAGVEVVGLDLAEARRAPAPRVCPGADVQGLRDCWMALRIGRVLRSRPQSKIAVLVGALHAQQSWGPANLQALSGDRSRSYAFLIPDAEGLPRLDSVRRALLDSGRGREAVVVPFPEPSAFNGFLAVPAAHRASAREP